MQQRSTQGSAFSRLATGVVTSSPTQAQNGAKHARAKHLLKSASTHVILVANAARDRDDSFSALVLERS
jgi:hypothetical protein